MIMKIVKYIIKKDGTPILFNTNVMHSDVIELVISAGFVIVNYDMDRSQFNAKCYGKSSSLKIGSKESDFLLIEKLLNNKLDSEFYLSFFLN